MVDEEEVMVEMAGWKNEDGGNLDYATTSKCPKKRKHKCLVSVHQLLSNIYIFI